MEKQKKSLTQTFNETATQPAKRFDLKTGLVDGISGQYVFPNGLSAPAFEELHTWRFLSTGILAKTGHSPSSTLRSVWLRGTTALLRPRRR